MKETVDLIVLQYYAWGFLLDWTWRVGVGEKEESRGMSKREFSEMNSFFHSLHEQHDIAQQIPATRVPGLGKSPSRKYLSYA